MPRDGFDGMVVPPFGFLTGGTPAVPEFYWNVYSQEQRWKFLCVNLKRLCDFANQLNINIGINADNIDKLEKAIDDLKDGGWKEYYQQAVRDWINQNMEGIIKESISFVMFGVNDDGRFVAYVPESWSEIRFDYGAVYGRSDYNRIKLQFDAQGNAINNLYSYTLAQPHSVEQLIADLELTTSRGDVTYNTVFTNMNEEVEQDAHQ